MSSSIIAKIAINWVPEGGQNMLEALVSKLAARMPPPVDPKTKLSRRSSEKDISVRKGSKIDNTAAEMSSATKNVPTDYPALVTRTSSVGFGV